MWRLKSVNHDNSLLSSTYLRRGIMRDSVEFADLRHVVSEITPLCYTIQLFVCNTCSIDLHVRTVQNFGVDSVFHYDSSMPVHLDFFMMIYND